MSSSSPNREHGSLKIEVLYVPNSSLLTSFDEMDLNAVKEVALNVSTATAVSKSPLRFLNLIKGF